MIFGDAELTFYRIKCRIDLEKIPDKDLEKFSDRENMLFQLHRHSYYECHLVTSGNASFEVNGRIYSVEAGELFIIPPNAHHYTFQNDSTRHEIVLALTINRTLGEEGFFDYFKSSLENAVLMPLSIGADMYNSFVRFHEMYDSTSMRDKCFNKTQAYDIAVRLFDYINGFNSTEPSHADSGTTDEHLHITLEVMLNDVNCPLPVIAERLGYTTRHTSRLIKNIFGMSFREIRTTDMLNTAKSLLIERPDTPIKAVAAMAGFTSAENMRKTFIRTLNMSPKEFREKGRLH
nr:AraC family transcriptional regulator [Clostridia bacterium]